MQNKKTWIVISCACAGIGTILLIFGLLFGGRPGIYVDAKGFHAISEIDQNKREVQAKQQIEAFEAIDIAINYGDIEIIPSDGYYLEYNLDGLDAPLNAKVENGTLIMKESSGFWLFTFFVGSIGTHSERSFVKLYVPEDHHFSSIKLNSDTGDIEATAQLVTDRLDISSEYGNINLEYVEAGKVTTHQQEGALNINKVVATEIVTKNEYGPCELKDITCNKMTIRTDSGNVNLPKTDVKEALIKTSYGNVSIGLANESSKYDLKFFTEYGDIEVAGQKMGGDPDDKTYEADNGTGNLIKIRCDEGDISLTQ